MVVQKYGLTNWNEPVSGGKNSNHKKDEWMRLKDGSNMVRVVTQPHQYYVHKYQEEGDTGFGDKIYCSAPGRADKACPVCDQKNQKDPNPKQRWFIGIIDRETQTYKLLDIGFTIHQAIKKYNDHKSYGSPSKYDLDIIVDRNGKATGYYQILPLPAEPLSANDLKIIEDIKLENIAFRCTPPTCEKALERLNAVREKKGKTPVTWKAPVVSSVDGKQEQNVQLVVDTDSGDEFDFPQESAN